MNTSESFFKALKLAADHFNRGRYAEAEECASIAANDLPDSGDAWKIIGVARFAQGEDACAALTRAAGLLPLDAQILSYLAAEYMRLGELDRAERCLNDALRVDSVSALAAYHLGRLRAHQNKLQEAEALFKRVLLSPDPVPGALYSLGNAQFNLGKYSEAETSIREAIRQYPDQAEAYVALGMLLLLKGQLEEGFALYARYRTMSAMPQGPNFSFPQWNGMDDLHGKRLLVLCAEQGFGDAIQFVRFAKVLEERGAIVSVGGSQELHRLFLGLELHGGIYANGATLPEFDFWCYSMSMPAVLGITLDSIPLSSGYFPVAGMPAQKREILRVGVAWQGNPRHANDARRSLRLRQLEPLFRLPNVEVVSLQRDVPDMDAETAARLEFGPTEKPIRDFQDTADLICNVDLVIAVDSAVAHLAAAMGRETWVMLPQVPDWRWLLDRTDSPWYRSMRLFRQTADGEWSDVVGAISALLLERASMR